MDRLKLLFVLIAIIILSVSIATATHKPIPESQKKEDVSAYPKDVNYRLPKSSHPEKYNVALTWIDDEKFTFNGIVTIDIVIQNDTNTVVVHKRQIDIKTVTLKPSSGVAVEVPFTYSNITDFLTITSSTILTARSRYTLEITYSGMLRTDNRGFFRQSYITENGEKRQDKKNTKLENFSFYRYYNFLDG